MASVTAAANEVPTSNDNGDWGWEPLGSEDEEPDDTRAIVTNVSKQTVAEDADGKPPVTKSMSNSSTEKQHTAIVNKRAGSFSGKPIQGIVSSPSFLELEKAIGATLNLASSESGELAEARSLTPSTSGSFPARLSSTNLTQQKVNHQRLRLHQHQQAQRNQGQNQYGRSPHSGSFGPYGMVPAYPFGAQLPPAQGPPSRTELGPFINEVESRAIILFHSVHVSTAEIRNACSKHGVLYYIRPEFHARGVTFISYFDLRCAISAKARLAEELGRNADASVHYSVMLHAANGNSEESRLVVPSLPAHISEAEVQSVFERYGQLRTTQKCQGDASSSLHQRKTSQTTTSESSPVGPAADSTVPDADHTAYVVEYYNIQDARLAASELSATSAQLWGTDVMISFAALDDRKQLLCRQLLATLSRWRTEMAAAAAAYNMSVQQQQQHQHQLHYHHHQQQQLHAQQQARPFLPMGMMMALPQHVSMLGTPAAGFAQAPFAGPVPYGQPSGDDMGPLGYYEQHAQDHPTHHALAPQYAGQFDSHGHPQVLVPVPGFPGSPMRGGMFPGTNLSNPNLFNLGLLAAQAEAQMQQQSQSQSQRQQQAQQAQQVHAASGDGDHSGVHQEDSALEQRPQQHAPKPPSHSSTSPRSPAPQHHNGAYNANHASSTGGQQFSPSHGGGRSGPLHHHHHQQYFPPQYAHHPHGGGPVYQHNGFPGTAAPQQQGSNVSSPSHQAQLQQQQLNGRRGRAQGQPTGQVGSAGGGHQIDTDFALDLKRLEAETETRTTVMVRNIPNKYNQQMLLDEVNAHHEGTYDFFYLPIDFKNRCNVGYCFINFLEARFIAPFVRTFNGQRWKSFNSEKVCAISFARIQGKQAMIARFQNSSLLEKDDEYRPLLFHSSGPDRGKPEPFPMGNGGGGRSKQQSHSQPPSAQHSRPSSVSPSPPVGSPAAGPRHLHAHSVEDRSSSSVSSSHSRASPVESAGASA